MIIDCKQFYFFHMIMNFSCHVRKILNKSFMFFLFYPCLSLLFILLSSHLIFVLIFNKFLLSSSTSCFPFISSFLLYFSHLFAFLSSLISLHFFPFPFPFSSPFPFPFLLLFLFLLLLLFLFLRLVFFMYF